MFTSLTIFAAASLIYEGAAPTLNMAIADLVLAGLAAGGGALLSGLLGSISSKSVNSDNIAAQQDLLHQQQDYQTMMWNATNAYNSPLNQRKLLESAGFNPNLLGGTQVSNSSLPSAPSVPSLSLQGDPSRALQAGLLQGFQSIGNIANIELTQAQTKQVEAQTAKLNAEVPFVPRLVESQIESFISQANLSQSQSDSVRANLEQLLPLLKDKTSSEIESINQQISNARELFWNIITQRNLTDAQIEKTIADTNLVERQTLTEQARSLLVDRQATTELLRSGLFQAELDRSPYVLQHLQESISNLRSQGLINLRQAKALQIQNTINGIASRLSEASGIPITPTVFNNMLGLGLSYGTKLRLDQQYKNARNDELQETLREQERIFDIEHPVVEGSASPSSSTPSSSSLIDDSNPSDPSSWYSHPLLSDQLLVELVNRAGRLSGRRSHRSIFHYSH